MKRVSLVLLLFISFISCRKIWDKIYDGHDTPPATPCRVVGWTVGEYNPREETTPIATSILYDDKGNPISVQDQDYASNPNANNDHFSYDSQNRLILYDRHPANGYTTYTYQGNAKVPVLDSTYDVSDEVFVSHYEYDQKKRITSVTTYLVRTWQGPVEHPDTTVKHFYYDTDGNRQTTGEPLIVYNTSKYSIYSLHPTWQLIFANYSINATTAALTFNEYGLPLTFDASAAGPKYSQGFYGSNYANDGVGYDCSKSD